MKPLAENSSKQPDDVLLQEEIARKRENLARKWEEIKRNIKDPDIFVVSEDMEESADDIRIRHENGIYYPSERQSIVENSSGQPNESPDKVEWEEIDGKPFRRQVPMPENWKSSWSDEGMTWMKVRGGIQEFWEYYEDGEIVEEWSNVND